MATPDVVHIDRESLTVQKRNSITTCIDVVAPGSKDVSLSTCEVNTIEINSDMKPGVASQLTISEITKSTLTVPQQGGQKRKTSVTFSTTIKRNGSIVQAVDSFSKAVIQEEPEEASQGGIVFSNPSYSQKPRSDSNTSSIDRIEPPRSKSIDYRPRAMSRNISFSTARRCSNFAAVREGSIAPSVSSAWSYQSRIYQEPVKPIYDAENELVKVSRLLLRIQKYGLLAVFIAINAILIWATFTHYSRIWWFILAILSVNTFAQVIFALMIIVVVVSQRLWRCVRPPIEDEPAEAERVVMLLPCYNEDRQEMQDSVNSLVRQIKIDQHPRIMMIIVDGNARAPGEDISTQDFLLNEMFAGGERTVFTNGYIARDAQSMSVTIQEGVYKGVPYVVIAKSRNLGKRDSLCFVRSFMWHYHNQSDEIPTMFDPDLFDYLGSILLDNGLERVDYLTGMDGDTVFDDDCVYELIKSIRRLGPNVVGVCGAVLVKFDNPPPGLLNKFSFYFWTFIQNAEYMATQGLRREFQSRVTGKVNCLPGCCQLIRVSEATFGDEVLRVKFGYVPKPNDLMTQQIMGVYSEDSLHASIIFSLFPASQTAQALRARAYTTVPVSWKVYLSQRKRWALGSLCNESLMVFRRNILWIERISSIITITTWWIGPFVYASVIGFLISIAHHGTHLFDDRLFVGLICIILFRYLYTFMIVTWFPHNWTSRGRYLVGFFINLVVSPLINIIITIYSLMHCDEFSWGKTRVSADGDQGHGSSSRQELSEKDVERQGPSIQEQERHAMDKFTQKGSCIG